MKIAAAQTSPGPRQIQIRTTARRDRATQDTSPRRGKIRHVLHGWRVLLAPLVTQVLDRTAPHEDLVPVGHALEAYRRRSLTQPEARLLRDI